MIFIKEVVTQIGAVVASQMRCILLVLSVVYQKRIPAKGTKEGKMCVTNYSYGIKCIHVLLWATPFHAKQGKVQFLCALLENFEGKIDFI